MLYRFVILNTIQRHKILENRSLKSWYKTRRQWEALCCNGAIPVMGRYSFHFLLRWGLTFFVPEQKWILLYIPRHFSCDRSYIFNLFISISSCDPQNTSKRSLDYGCFYFQFIFEVVGRLFWWTLSCWKH